MPDKLVIVPCGKKKIWDDGVTKWPVSARLAYTGTAFRLGVEYASELGADFVILSAKYGYLSSFEMIEPYNVTFNNKSTNPISVYDLEVQIKSKNLESYDEIIALGGKKYLNVISRSFSGYKTKQIVTPFAGLSIGDYLHALKEAVKQQIIDNVGAWYDSSYDSVKHEDGKIIFPWKYWFIPTREGAFNGWLEGPGPTRLQIELEHLKVDEKRKLILEYGPRAGAWDQCYAISNLISKRVNINMGDNIYGEEAYPFTADMKGIHLCKNDEGFTECYLCLDNIQMCDSNRPEFCMYDNSYALREFHSGMKLLDISEVYELTII